MLNARAYYLGCLGRTREAVEVMRRAVELDPLDSIHAGNLARLNLAAGRYSEAKEWARRAEQLSPERKMAWIEGWAALLGGNAALALSGFERIDGPRSLAGATAALHALGRSRESKAALERLEGEHPDELILIAGARAWRGDVDGGFAALDDAIQTKHWALSRLRINPSLRPLHSDPRFPALLRKLGFPEDEESGQPPAP